MPGHGDVPHGVGRRPDLLRCQVKGGVRPIPAEHIEDLPGVLLRPHAEAEVQRLPGDGGRRVLRLPAVLFLPGLPGLEVLLVAGGHLVAGGIGKLLGRQQGDGGVGAVDPDEEAVVHPDVVVGEAEVIRHHPGGDEDLAIALHGGRVVVVAVAAGDVAGVQLEDQRPPLAAGLQYDHSAVDPIPVAVEAQPTVREDGAVHVEILPGPEGHGLLLQLQDVLVHRRKVDALCRRRGDGQKRKHPRADQKHCQPLPHCRPSLQKLGLPSHIIGIIAYYFTTVVAKL